MVFLRTQAIATALGGIFLLTMLSGCSDFMSRNQQMKLTALGGAVGSVIGVAIGSDKTKSALYGGALGGAADISHQLPEIHLKAESVENDGLPCGNHTLTKANRLRSMPFIARSTTRPNGSRLKMAPQRSSMNQLQKRFKAQIPP